MSGRGGGILHVFQVPQQYMGTDRYRWALGLWLGACVTASASGQACGIELSATDAAELDAFGACVALDTDLAIAGAPEADAGAVDCGAAYVFRSASGSWTEEAKLVATDGMPADGFGADVVIAGDQAVVGAPGADAAAPDAGAVYVFRHAAGVWMQEAKLTAPVPVPVAGLGTCVALAPGLIVAGAPGTPADGGATYVFRDVAGTWLDEATLSASDAGAGDRFGASLATDGARVLIGAPGDDDAGLDAGSAYSFTDGGAGLWLEAQKLLAGDGSAGDAFGTDIALLENQVLLGAPGAEAGAGAVYVYRLSLTWIEVQMLTASTPAAGAAFGSAVAAAGDDALVGAPHAAAGAVFVFRREASLWSERRRAVAMAGQPGDGFGVGVAVQAGTAFLGADGRDVAAQDAGSVTVLPDVSAPYEVVLLPAFTVRGDASNDAFGYSVGGGGDVDGDGLADVVVGAYFDDAGGPDSGQAQVFSGADGALIHTFDGAAGGDLFGRSVAIAGDVDCDGHADVIVGAPWHDAAGFNAGHARVFSGGDGSLLHTFDGLAPSDRLGWFVSGAGDTNGDGHDDLIVGAYLHDGGGADAGAAFVYCGDTGNLLFQIDGTEGDSLGQSVSGAGDVNGDGFDDVIVGAPNGNHTTGPETGKALVYSGFDGTLLHSLFGEALNDNFGFSVGGAGDVNADGHADLVVGARLNDSVFDQGGAAYVYSGADGSQLHAFYGAAENDRFGYSVSGAGDVNGDGNDDVLVGAKNGGPNHEGCVEVRSGLDGSILYTRRGESQDDFFGRSVSRAGDVNGDGFEDLVIGSDGDDENAQGAGAVHVFAAPDCNGNGRADWCDIALGEAQDSDGDGVLDVCESIGTPYCGPAVPNSSGAGASILASGTAVAANNDFYLHADGLPVNQFGYFLASSGSGLLMPPGSQGNLCLALGNDLGRLVTQVENSGATGAFSIQVDLTNVPTATGSVALQSGDTWYFQAWFRDFNPMQTSNFTDGLEVSFF
ncbi:MAG: hypothetical protein GY711_08205 [bacterium]|nr:hypothetical protein [bacterium]